MSRTLPRRLLTRQPYICTACSRSLRKPFSSTLLSRQQQQQQQSILHVLEERGYINQIAGDREALDALLSRRKVGFYVGVDPTAPSLHLGHLLPCMVLFWLWHHGHHVVSLIGGATAKVGDPSGRLTSRVDAGEDAIQRNYERMVLQVEGLWGNVRRYGERHGQQEQNGNGTGLGKREVLNNADWLEGLNVLKFLKMMGNGARLGAMLSRDTVRNKMDKGDGMSFAEFTYPLLQAWDWWHLYEERGVQIQIGGGDQYGNIIAGIDAVKSIAQQSHHARGDAARPWLDKNGRLKDEHAPMGLTVPLLTTSSGEKFGKSAGNAIWLDATMTSPFDLYGFLLRSADADVERYLKLFTFVSLEDIRSIMAAQRAEPGKRPAQHLLASEVLELVHGAEIARSTRAEHEAARSPTLAALSGTVAEGGEDGEQARIKLPRSLVLNTPFARILYHAGLVATKSEGARTISTGGVYVALQKSATNTAYTEGGGEQEQKQLKFVPLTKDLSAADVLTNGVMVLRLGKWKVRVVEVLDDGAFEEEKGASNGLPPPGWEEWKARSSRTVQ